MSSTEHIFERALARFKKSAEAAFGSSDFFQNPEYEQRRADAVAVFDMLAPVGNGFLEIVNGHVADGRSFGQPDTGPSLCFPHRFLGVQSTDELGSPTNREIGDLLTDIFFGGLLFHLLAASFPTRNRLAEVDLDSLGQDWYLRALLASRFMKDYDRDVGGEATSVFDAMFDADISQYLSKSLMLGFWRRAKARGNLKNLYFAGALLGMMADVSTSQL